MAGPLRRRNALIAFAARVRPGDARLGRRLAALPRLIKATLAAEYDGGGRLSLMGLATIYIVSPVDFVPELLLGLFGLVDDPVVAVWLAGACCPRPSASWSGRRQRLTKVIPRGMPVHVVRVRR